MSETDYETPGTGEQPAPPAPTAAARQVSITLNNFSSSALHLRGSSLSHGILNPGPPQTIYAGTSGHWQAESSGVLTGTEGSVWYVPEDGVTEFELYWDNPAIGSNSYGSSVKNASSDVWNVTNAGTDGNSSSVNYTVYEMVQQWSPSSWMKGIEDSRSLGRMSIPGTHESASTYSSDGDILGVVITQDQSIIQQLNSGIRFLDMRCRVDNGVLTIHHDSVYQNLNLGDVLTACTGFLTVNLSEMVLIRIKQEYSAASDAEFNAVFSQYLDHFSGILFRESRVPTLGEVRGKIVLISNVAGLPGIPWDSIVVQDNYNPSGGLAEKTNSISENLTAAIANHSGGGSTLYLNFISKQGVPLLQTINQAASKLNSAFLSMMGDKKAPVAIGVGIIAMDFPNRTGGAIPVIINSNFRLVNEQFYALTQNSVPAVTAGSTTSFNFTFTTDNRPPVPGSRLHAVAPPGTRIVDMSYRSPETLTISGDGKTADVVAGNTTEPWYYIRSITLAVNSDAELGTVLKGSIQYYNAEGLPGVQMDLDISTSAFSIIPSGNNINVQPGGTAQFRLSGEPSYIHPPTGTRLLIEAAPHTKITGVTTSWYSEADVAWYGESATITVLNENMDFWADVTLSVDEDTPMDTVMNVLATHIPPTGKAGEVLTITLNTASKGIVDVDNIFKLNPGESGTVGFTLETYDDDAIPGSRLHVAMPQYVRIVDMSHNEHEVLSISSDGRSADIIAVAGAGPWERARTITVMVSSDAPLGWAEFGSVTYYGASGLEALTPGAFIVYVPNPG